RHDHADLLGEIDETLQDQRLRAQFGEGRRELGWVAQQRLALAVIAQPRGLEDRRQAVPGGRLPQLRQRLDRRPRRGAGAGAVEEALLRDPVLADPQDRGRGADRLERCEKIEPFGADILELEGNHVDRGGEGAQRRGVLILAEGDAGGDLRGRAVLLGREDVAAIAQTGRRQRRHAAELAAADDADRRVRSQGKNHAGSGWSVGVSGTRSVCAARKASSRSASAGSVIARIAAASRAAFTAPARPIAKVPTGMPAGICTMESRLSKPLSCWDATGTPSTGSAVQAAHMPGGCAAPPAAAMMTR